MVLRTILCAHCRGEAAQQTCRHCGSAVCERCFGDETTCPVPRARVLRLGLGRRLRRIDPAGRLALVSGWRGGLRLYDLERGQGLEAPGTLPGLTPKMLLAPEVSSVARDGRLVWPAFSMASNSSAPVFLGVHVGSVSEVGEKLVLAQRPEVPRELVLCPAGRNLWFRTTSETVQVWDLKTGEQHVHDPLPGSVLQAAAMSTTEGLLATATYGRACVHRVQGGEDRRLGTLRVLHDADNVWLGLAPHCLAVLSDYRGRRGHVIRAFALDAAGVPEREPFYVYEEADAAAGARRRVRPLRPVVAMLSQDGRYLAMATESHDVALHDLSRKRVQYLGGHTDDVVTIAFTDGVKALVTGDADNRVIIRPHRDEHFIDLAPGSPR
jgi:hypothetical protein